jgi:hypothetical protein
MDSPGVQIIGLRELRASLRASADAAPREATAAVKRVGAQVILPRIRAIAPVGHRPDDKHPGMLRRGYKISVSGSSGSVVNSAPWSAGAEWGQRGKWRGFTRYPSVAGGGRFAWRAISEQADKIVEGVYAELLEVLTAHGWFREGGAP